MEVRRPRRPRPRGGRGPGGRRRPRRGGGRRPPGWGRGRPLRRRRPGGGAGRSLRGVALGADGPRGRGGRAAARGAPPRGAARLAAARAVALELADYSEAELAELVRRDARARGFAVDPAGDGPDWLVRSLAPRRAGAGEGEGA